MRKKSLKFNKILFSLVAFCIMISFGSSLFADKVSDLQNQLNQIAEQKRKIESELKGVNADIKQYILEMVDLDGQIVKYDGELNILQAKVNDVTKKLQEQEDSLQNAAQKYNSAEDMYMTRIRAIYENGIPSIMDLLFSSQGISDFFSKMNVYTSILEYDKSLVGNMKSEKEYIDYIKKDIESQKSQIDQLKYDTQKSTDALNSAKKAKENKVNELNNSKDKLSETQYVLDQKEQAAAKALQKAIAEMENENISFNGQFLWPVSGHNVITARYLETYQPFPGRPPSTHYGTDVGGSGIGGKPILAIESGIVKISKYGWNDGYGNYVIIDHGKSSVDGNNYKSLYAHAISLTVSAGQYVTRGQTIGYVGTTGNSSGNHLHLEIFKNGKGQDALNYYKGMNFIFR